MEFPSEAELIDWAIKRGYGDFIKNIELLKILYAKDHGKTKVTIGRKGIVEAERITKIIDIPKRSGEYVTIQGIVAQIEERKYRGCLICGRKNCTDHGSMGEIVLQHFIVGDDTGLIWCLTRKGRFDFKEKDEVKIKGKTNMFRDMIELSVSRLEVIKSHE